MFHPSWSTNLAVYEDRLTKIGKVVVCIRMVKPCLTTELSKTKNISEGQEMGEGM
jgi:hypothetical protein